MRRVLVATIFGNYSEKCPKTTNNKGKINFRTHRGERDKKHFSKTKLSARMFFVIIKVFN